jgi:hypothetical protein
MEIVKSNRITVTRTHQLIGTGEEDNIKIEECPFVPLLLLKPRFMLLEE